MDVTEDSPGLTVRTVRFAPGRGPVFYVPLSCEPWANEALPGGGKNGAGVKHRLVSTLWDHLVTLESPLWKGRQSSKSAAFPIRVVRGRLGRPHLLFGDYRGPAISFSESGGKVWAALCGDESDIGLDVAGSDEFQKKYPSQRVFQPQELQHALRLTGGELAEASALLWSIKEAVVKALGCAFHLVDPRQITVYPSTGEAVREDSGYTFPVGLSGKALMRFPLAGTRSLWVRSLPQVKRWLSIALLNPHHR